MAFLWVKAAHIIFMVTWMAGIFYLPRLFVYHAQTEDQISHDRFIIMERKLYRGIMMPSMIITLLLGGWLAYQYPNIMQFGWMHAKLTCVFLLVIYHFYCGHLLKQFRDKQNQHSHIWYRWFNEIPVLFLSVIVIAVVVKPF